MRTLIALVALSGCPDSRELVLDGPAQVTVDALGPVQGPRVLLNDGTEPEGLVLTATPAEVATVDGLQVTAAAPGTASIDASWNGKSIRWSLVVDPRITLLLVNPPGSLTVGARQPMHVEARMGDRTVDPGELTWSSSDPDVADVDAAGVVVAKAEGTTYLIVKRGSSEAMAQLTVQSAE